MPVRPIVKSRHSKCNKEYTKRHREATNSLFLLSSTLETSCEDPLPKLDKTLKVTVHLCLRQIVVNIRSLVDVEMLASAQLLHLFLHLSLAVLSFLPYIRTVESRHRQAYTNSTLALAPRSSRRLLLLP